MTPEITEQLNKTLALPYYRPINNDSSRNQCGLFHSIIQAGQGQYNLRTLTALARKAWVELGHSWDQELNELFICLLLNGGFAKTTREMNFKLSGA